MVLKSWGGRDGVKVGRCRMDCRMFQCGFVMVGKFGGEFMVGHFREWLYKVGTQKCLGSRIVFDKC